MVLNFDVVGAEYKAFPRANEDISGKFQLHMLHMSCNTSSTLKIC